MEEKDNETSRATLKFILILLIAILVLAVILTSVFHSIKRNRKLVDTSARGSLPEQEMFRKYVEQSQGAAQYRGKRTAKLAKSIYTMRDFRKKII